MSYTGLFSGLLLLICALISLNGCQPICATCYNDKWLAEELSGSYVSFEDDHDSLVIYPDGRYKHAHITKNKLDQGTWSKEMSSPCQLILNDFRYYSDLGVQFVDSAVGNYYFAYCNEQLDWDIEGLSGILGYAKVK